MECSLHLSTCVAHLVDQQLSCGFPVSARPALHVLPDEKSQHAVWRADLICEIKVTAFRGVEVNGSFYQALPQHIAVEIHIDLCITGHGSQQ